MAKKSADEKLLTIAELELMSILWRNGEGTVSDVQAELPSDRDLAYTTVSTIMRILEQKKFLKTRKEGRGHVYIPTISKADYETRAVRDVVDKVFEGAPLALARQLISTTGLSTSDLEALKKLIAEAEKNR